MESTANQEETKAAKADFFFSKYFSLFPHSNSIFSRLDQIFDEFYLSEFQKVMATHFIRDHLAIKENSKIERIREWLMLKLNSKNVVDFCHPFQVGCPEIIPNLTASPFWSFF